MSISMKNEFKQNKTVVIAMDNSSTIQIYKHIVSLCDIAPRVGMPNDVEHVLSRYASCDLLILEAIPDIDIVLAKLDASEEKPCSALLLVMKEEQLGNVRFPVNIQTDFILQDASENECLARVNKLLYSTRINEVSEVMTIDAMTINFATYQVTVGDIPVDFTYLEYALLSFLVTHSGRTFTRDELLKEVWGFDFSCGSRTVDVHVRRVRAKLGPELAQHLETVRGVGYLWNN